MPKSILVIFCFVCIWCFFWIGVFYQDIRNIYKAQQEYERDLVELQHKNYELKKQIEYLKNSYDVGRYIDIKTNLFECYATYDDIVYFPAEFRLHSEKDIERNNIKRMRDTLDFIENNSDKINGIIRVTLLHREIND